MRNHGDVALARSFTCSALVVVAILAIGVAGCEHERSPLAPSAATPPATPAPSNNAPTFELAGTVRSAEDGAVLAAATIAVASGPQASDPATTNDQGQYVLAGLVEGTYTLQVTRPGFDTTTASVLIQGHRTLDFDLTPVAGDAPAPDPPDPAAEWTLSGRVTSGAGSPVAGARVVVIDASGAEAETWSSADGRYALERLGTGQHTVRVEAEGFAAVHRTIAIEDGDVTLDVSLAAVSPPAPVPPTVTGRTIDVLSGLPVADVHVRVEGGGEAVSEPDGTFAVTGTSGRSERITLSSTVTVDRQTAMHADSGGALSLIPRSFDLRGFDQMLRSRGGLLRWVEAPRLVIERRVLTFTNTGDPAYVATSAMLTEEEVNELISDLAWALPQLTGGTFQRFSAVDIRASDEGSAVPISQSGSIIVARFDGLEAGIAAWGYGRWAWNGAGQVTAGAIMLDAHFETSGSVHRRSLRAHELGHALGYEHVTSRASVMDISGRVEPTDFDRDATRIAFQRPPLNASPDTDPDAATVSRRAATAGLQWAGQP